MDSYEYVVCRICKEKKMQLNVHIKNKHNMTVDEYKEKFLNSPITSQKIIDKIKKNKVETKEERSRQAKQDFADGKRKVSKGFGRSIGGKRGDLNNQYFRATWEANIARILKLKNIDYKFEETSMPLYDECGNLKFAYNVDFYLPKYL
ncbi:MAG: hypothetical protein K0R18_484 [Bacillales bacterium]|jgi:hypothetical protein|nr:hypothetical protein [Bacillales bacterium]